MVQITRFECAFCKSDIGFIWFAIFSCDCSLVHNTCNQALSRQGAILFPSAVALFGRGHFAILCFVKNSGVVGSVFSFQFSTTFGTYCPKGVGYERDSRSLAYNSLDVRHAAIT